ncbi:MAG TPA: carboxylesterase/lipase family protein [Kofleriaceae bacterium]|nr:carboxylesterase/lipase family protein [Kofleriaceae bacterium]
MRPWLLAMLFGCNNVHLATPDDVVACLADHRCVRGQRIENVDAFRGIPYAAPPVGPLRWKPPAPASWTGTRDALAFGKACPQLDDTIGGKLETDEDCLTLNVWTPDVHPRAPRPVMVWIHGGGLVQGGTALPFYDGHVLAGQGDVVVVSLAYRLGPLGFLAHPAFSAEDAHHSSGDFGLLDQIAALHWVHDHAAAFGGDPAKVTIFGESAGGESVCALMASPLAAGLFERAVIESAQCPAPGKAARLLRDASAGESAEQQGLRIAHLLGCDGAAAASCLRAKSVDQLLHASPAAFGFLGKGEHYGVVIDGHVLPEAPASALAAGHLARVPVVIGTNADEATLFTARMPLRRDAGYDYLVRKIFPDDADAVLAAYPATGSPKQAFDRLVTDAVFACPTRRFARALRGRQPVFQYEFAHATAKLRARGLGAMHGSEIPFVFADGADFTAGEQQLSRTMLGYWAQFAHTGDPDRTGSPVWPASDPGDAYLELDLSISARTNLHGAGCDVLDHARIAEN